MIKILIHSYHLGAFCDTVSQRSNFKNWKRHADVLQQRYRQLKMPEFQLLCKTAGTSEQEQHLTGDFRCYFGTEVLIVYHYLPPNFFCALKLKNYFELQCCTSLNLESRYPDLLEIVGSWTREFRCINNPESTVWFFTIFHILRPSTSVNKHGVIKFFFQLCNCCEYVF